MSMEFEFLFDLKLAHHQSFCSSPEPGCVHPDVQGRHEAEDVSGGGGLGKEVEPEHHQPGGRGRAGEGQPGDQVTLCW